MTYEGIIKILIVDYLFQHSPAIIKPTAMFLGLPDPDLYGK